MQLVTGMLALATVAALIVGVIGLVQPNRWVTTRPRAFGLVAVALVMFAVVAAISPPPSAAVALASRPRPNINAAPTTAAPPGPSRDLIDASFTSTQTALLAAAKPCDAATKKAAQTHGQYASYNMSVVAKEVCRQTAIDIRNVRFQDPVPSAAQDDLNKAVDCFATAYSLRAGAMEQAAAIMDGDQRPSKVTEFRDTMTYAGEQHHACLEQYGVAAGAHGFAKQLGWTDKD